MERSLQRRSNHMWACRALASLAIEPTHSQRPPLNRLVLSCIFARAATPLQHLANAVGMRRLRVFGPVLHEPWIPA